MNDLGLPTPEDIAINPLQYFPIERLFIGPNNCGLKPGYYERKIMPSIPVIDFTLIEGTGNRCGCCHQPIKAREGIAFGRPGLLGGRMPPINVCAKCVKLAVIHLESAKEGLI